MLRKNDRYVKRMWNGTVKPNEWMGAKLKDEGGQGDKREEGKA